MKFQCIRLASALSCVGALAIPIASQAQVYGIGPDGQLGYVTTPTPISPPCLAPKQWTQQSNGVYLCQMPASASPSTPPFSTIVNPPPSVTLVSVSGFYVPVQCSLYSPVLDGYEYTLIYKQTYSDGSVAYYQSINSSTITTLLDGSGNFYDPILGDNDPVAGPASLYIGQPDPNYPSVPTAPLNQCTHSDGSNQ